MHGTEEDEEQHATNRRGQERIEMRFQCEQLEREDECIPGDALCSSHRKSMCK